MTIKVYTVKEGTIGELKKALADGYEFAYSPNACPSARSEYYRIVKDGDEDWPPHLHPVDPAEVGIPLRPYDGREVFLRRPSGINVMFTADAEVALNKFYQLIWMAPPAYATEKTTTIPIPSLITVAELKAIVNKLPEKDLAGEDFHIHLAEGIRDKYYLAPDQFLLEPTERKLADGSFGVELTIITE